MQAPQIQQVSEDSLFLNWIADEEIPSPKSARILGQVAQALIELHPQVILNAVPSYQSLLVQFNVLQTDAKQAQDLTLQQLDRAIENSGENETKAKLHRIPVFYDPRVADDMLAICEAKKLTTEELITLHTAITYSVYAIGFQPGFAYLGYVTERLAMPRKTSFSAQVAAGSVGIADRQTAVYPSNSPGGWNIIGRTPTLMVDGYKSRLMAGDQVQFYSVDENEFVELGGAI